jgi:hypothetical protein
MRKARFTEQSRWLRSSARRIALRCVGGLQAARYQRANDLHLRKHFGGFGANDVRRLKQLRV